MEAGHWHPTSLPSEYFAELSPLDAADVWKAAGELPPPAFDSLPTNWFTPRRWLSSIDWEQETADLGPGPLCSGPD